LEEKWYLGISEGWIRSVVENSQSEDRNYYEENRFWIGISRRVDGRRKRIILRVEETEDELVVLLAHLED
jgi:hypothetical protein